MTGTLAVANGGTGVTTSTGSGNNVLSASPTFTGTITAAAATFSGEVTCVVDTRLYLYNISAASRASFRALSASGNVVMENGVGGSVADRFVWTPAGDFSASRYIISTAHYGKHIALGGGTALDLALGTSFDKTISGTTTLTLSNTPASGNFCCFLLDLTNGGSATVNLWSGIDWAGGTAPTLTVAGRDNLIFYTYDGGTTWTGSYRLDVK
jgi:hypothetical protein